MARRKKVDDDLDAADINAEDIIHLHLYMADEFRKKLKDLEDIDSDKNEYEKLKKKISELENIDNALDTYNHIKGNLQKIPKIKKPKLEKIRKK